MNGLAAELFKLRTTRSTFGLLLGMLAITSLVVVGMVGSGALNDDQFTSSGEFVPDQNRALDLVSAIATGVGIFATILGIIIVTNEFRHGTITPTFLVTPRRERVIAAKVAAGALTGLAIAGLIAALAVAIAVPWLSARGHALAFDDELAVAAARLAATFILSVVFGIAVGTVIHSQIGAIVATFAWFLILEGILSVVAGYLVGFDRDPLGPYLPGSLFGTLAGGETDDDLDPQWALLLLVVYTGALVAVGTLLTLHRDAD